jgi:tetratricopeptide (TPR) repeat protein
VHREPPEGSAGAFRFRHALIQDATYLGLLRPERRALHARAAAALEAASCDRLPEVAAVLGRHYATAEDAERAVPYLEMAGDHATDAFANYEAISSFNAAMAVTRRQPRTMDADAVRLHAKLAGVLWRTGRRDQAGDAFRAALRLADSVDPLQLAHLYTRLGRLELTYPHYDAASAAFDAAEALLGDDPGGWDDATADQWLEMMVDGRAAIHSMRSEPEPLRAILERARPMLEARGTPARRHVFDRQIALEGIIRHRYRVEDAEIAGFRRSVELAEHTGDEREKDVGYATYFLGRALWLRGELAEARERSEAALAMAERIGETHLRSISLMALMLTALRAHDPESVRAIVPRATAAAQEDSSTVTGVMACQSWLAWQDGHPDQVIGLAGQIAKFDPATMAFGGRHRWVYLFPVIAARLRSGDTAAAVAAARQILDPSQQLLPDDLMAALDAACAAWDGNAADAAASDLADVLSLAHDLNYF